MISKKPLKRQLPKPPPRPYPAGFVQERSRSSQLERYTPVPRKKAK